MPVHDDDSTRAVERARLRAVATEWRALAEWLTSVARYIRTVEEAALLVSLHDLGETRGQIAELLGVSPHRVDQILSMGRQFERGSAEGPPPPWWSLTVKGSVPVPPEGYSPFATAEAYLAPPSRIHPNGT